MLHKHKKSHRRVGNLLVALVNFGLKLNLDRKSCFSLREIGFILLLKCLSGSPGEQSCSLFCWTSFSKVSGGPVGTFSLQVFRSITVCLVDFSSFPIENMQTEFVLVACLSF